MKKIGLLLAGAAALAASGMMSICASAATVIDFEDGDYSFVSMKTDDGGDNSKLSVAELDGSKQLKVDVSDCGNVPKVKFDLDKLIPADSFSRIRSIEMTVTLESKDDTPPGWAGGALGTQGAEDGAPAWAQTTWEAGEYDNARSKPFTVQRKFLLARERFANGTAGNHMILMRWGCDVDYCMYVDNVRFLDGSGDEIELLTGGSGTVVTEAQTEETTEATTAEPEETAAETAETAAEETVPEDVGTGNEPEEAVEAAPEAEKDDVSEDDKKEEAPDSDEDTTSSKTGNPAALLAASAVMLSGYAVSMTRSKKRKVSALLMKIN
ncbi:MAG: hypothetical protein NC120_00580 [Ruminococcus sp.]|nr:hypothetical protein [Ruminococcus sp.]